MNTTVTTTAPRVVILGVAASDAHAVANQLIAMMLRQQGFVVVNLGVCTPLEEFAEATRAHPQAEAVLIGSLNGHAYEDLKDLPDTYGRPDDSPARSSSAATFRWAATRARRPPTGSGRWVSTTVSRTHDELSACWTGWPSERRHRRPDARTGCGRLMTRQRPARPDRRRSTRPARPPRGTGPPASLHQGQRRRGPAHGRRHRRPGACNHGCGVGGTTRCGRCCSNSKPVRHGPAAVTIDSHTRPPALRRRGRNAAHVADETSTAIRWSATAGNAAAN